MTVSVTKNVSNELEDSQIKLEVLLKLTEEEEKS